MLFLSKVVNNYTYGNMFLQDLYWDGLPDFLPRMEKLQKLPRKCKALRQGLAYSDASSSPCLEVQRQHPWLWHKKKNQQRQNVSSSNSTVNRCRQQVS